MKRPCARRGACGRPGAASPRERAGRNRWIAPGTPQEARAFGARLRRGIAAESAPQAFRKEAGRPGADLPGGRAADARAAALELRGAEGKEGGDGASRCKPSAPARRRRAGREGAGRGGLRRARRSGAAESAKPAPGTGAAPLAEPARRVAAAGPGMIWPARRHGRVCRRVRQRSSRRQACPEVLRIGRVRRKRKSAPGQLAEAVTPFQADPAAPAPQARRRSRSELSGWPSRFAPSATLFRRLPPASPHGVSAQARPASGCAAACSRTSAAAVVVTGGSGAGSAFLLVWFRRRRPKTVSELLMAGASAGGWGSRDGSWPVIGCRASGCKR